MSPFGDDLEQDEAGGIIPAEDDHAEEPGSEPDPDASDGGWVPM